MVTFVVLRIVAVVLLVAANAFFVAAEFAMVSIRETRLQQLIAAHRMGARTVQKLHQKLDEFIAAVQFGVTLSSLALGWIGEAAMARVLEPLFARLPHSRDLRTRPQHRVCLHSYHLHARDPRRNRAQVFGVAANRDRGARRSPVRWMYS